MAKAAKTIDNSAAEETSGGMFGSYDRKVQGSSHALTSEYAEVRATGQNRAGLGETKDFEFGAGYTQTFIASRVKVIDRQTIMRLIERDKTREAGSEMITDYQKVETDALIGYTDYLAEIVFTLQRDSDLGMGFLVSVKEVGTGQIVAMFKSDGKVNKNSKPKVTYVGTAAGYEKVIIQAASAKPIEVGEELALETMQALSRVW